jgi:hypothetical protein
MGSQSVSLAKNLSINDQLQVLISADYFNTDGYIPTPTFFNGVYKLSAGQTSNSDTQANLRVESQLRIAEDTEEHF